MTDIIDQANERAEQFTLHAITNAHKFPSLPAVGACHNCNEHIAAGHLFCDADCRDDWQSRNPNR